MADKINFLDATNYSDAQIPSDLTQSLIDLRSIMSNSSDLMINTVTISGHNSAPF